ncbi:MAG: hypothetical protein ABJC39_10040 [Chloroflexota bacterium]
MGQGPWDPERPELGLDALDNLHLVPTCLSDRVLPWREVAAAQDGTTFGRGRLCDMVAGTATGS